MTTADLGRVDVLVIGAGNAAANAALQARELGASVAMIETAPREARGGGAQLGKTLHEAVERAGIEVLYDTTAVALIHAGGRVQGVRARRHGEEVELRAKAVVMACGGFESNPEMRARYLGPNWDLAK